MVVRKLGLFCCCSWLWMELRVTSVTGIIFMAAHHLHQCMSVTRHGTKLASDVAVVIAFVPTRAGDAQMTEPLLPTITTRTLRSSSRVVSKIQDRISLWSFIPKEHGESMQISKFGANQSDHNKDETQSSSGGNRLVTILMYLSDTKQGGETVFPRSELKDTQAKEGTLAECAGYAVKPVKGSAILLFNSRPDGVADKDSQYVSCSVLEGEKWLAIKHMHASKIDEPKSSPASEDDCTDEDDKCVGWAAAGECERNPVFMIGSPDYYGTCRKSCHAC